MKVFTLMLLFTAFAITASAQSSKNRKVKYSYNPYQAEAEYYREFNKRTNGIYRGAKVVREGARALTRKDPRVGVPYRVIDRQIQKRVKLPKKYRY